MAHGPGLGVIGKQVIVFIFPNQGVRRNGIQLAAAAVAHGFFRRPLGNLKAHLLVGGDSGVQKVDGVVDALVHAFGPVGHKHLALQRLCLVAGTKALQLFDERAALFFGKEFGGLHRVHQ